MTKVKQYDWSKLTPSSKEKKPLDNPRLWKFKPNKPAFSFFTCSKCKMDCKTRRGLKDHWLVEHDT